MTEGSLKKDHFSAHIMERKVLFLEEKRKWVKMHVGKYTTIEERKGSKRGMYHFKF